MISNEAVPRHCRVAPTAPRLPATQEAQSTRRCDDGGRRVDTRGTTQSQKGQKSRGQTQRVSRARRGMTDT